MSDHAEALVDAEQAAVNEMETILLRMRNEKADRVNQIDRDIPIKYAEITAVENLIEMWRRDRVYFIEQVRVLDARLALLKETF